jgi:hypothetical protein
MIDECEVCGASLETKCDCCELCGAMEKSKCRCCRICSGDGHVVVMDGEREYLGTETETCPACGGSGVR